MKKLFILFSIIITGLFLSSCNSCNPLPPEDDGMMYTYTYETEQIGVKDIQLPTLNMKLEVVDKLAPNTFVVECNFTTTEPVSINAISLVINYDSTKVVTTKDITINDKFYIEEHNNNELNASLFNNTGSQYRFAYFTLTENMLQNAFILRFIININEPTKISFSTIPGELDIVNIDSQKYPIEYQNIVFTEVE